MTDEQIESKIVKAFQMMYPHYYNLNIISRFTNQEKMITNLKDHFKEFTFKPKINKESANLDFQNISQVYAKL